MMSAPDYMSTKEWKEWNDGGIGLKPGAPEWFVKVVEDENKEREREYIEAEAKGILL
jgi:hypothetical protein